MPPLIGRFVPFLAVAAANSINLPLMRQRELKTGVPIYDEDNNYLGMSTVYYVINAYSTSALYWTECCQERNLFCNFFKNCYGFTRDG